MAITLGTVTTGSSTTLAYTVSSGAKALVVGICLTSSFTSQSISSVQWNGNAMTTAVSGSGDGCSSAGANGIYYILNPTSGSYNVTFSVGGGGSQVISVFAVELQTGLDTGSPVGTTYNNCVTNAQNRSITPVASSGVVFDTLICRPSGTPTANGTTQIFSVSNSPYYQCAAYKIFSSSPVAMNWDNVNGSTGPYHSIAEFKEEAAAGPANVKTIDGLAIASVKTVNNLAIASVKTWDGLA